MKILEYVLLALAGYVLGCFSMAMFLSRHVGKFDIRTRGSGNAGTTNMLREMGWIYGIITFIWDFVKALVPVLLAIRFLGYDAAYAVAAGVMLGHAFPVTRGFKGGKCVATAGGVFIALFPAYTAIPALIMIAAMFITRMVSVSALVAYILYAISLFIVPTPHPGVCWCVSACVLLVVILHHENIGRIIRGEEKRLTVKKTKDK